jgi:D-alanyl-D-alanine endopeptidase (penicillin-binding protein 7)
MQENPEEEANAKFMDLGAPKENRNFHAEKLLFEGHPTGNYHVNKDVDIDPIQRVFRITIQPHTRKQYIFWGICAVVIGISLVSFMTESALLIAAKIKGEDFATMTLPATLPATTTPSLPAVAQVQHLASTTKEYSFPATAKIPTTGALAYLVADIKTGEVIIQKGETSAYPLASVTKLMTALVATENMDLKKYTTVSRDSYNTLGAEGNLALGEKLKLSDLMYPLLMESSNDGAEVIADEYGHPEFLQMMNKTAALLGMKNTYYEDPSGLNPKNVSTVGDQFKLAKYIYEKYPSIFDTTLVKIFKVGNHTWTNRNAILLNISTFIGGKNGFIDEAKQTTVSLFNVQMLKGGQRVLAVIELKSPDKTTDAKRLLDFVTKNVTYTPIEIQEVGIK